MNETKMTCQECGREFLLQTELQYNKGKNFRGREGWTCSKCRHSLTTPDVLRDRDNNQLKS